MTRTEKAQALRTAREKRRTSMAAERLAMAQRSGMKGAHHVALVRATTAQLRAECSGAPG